MFNSIHKSLVILLIIVIAVSYTYSQQFQYSGQWQFQERGFTGGTIQGGMYYPYELNVSSPSFYIDEYSRYSTLLDNIEDKVGVVPNVIIWEHDTTQTFQFYAFHAFLDSPIDSNMTWSQLNKNFFFKIESLDSSSSFYQPFNQSFPDTNIVLREIKEIGHYFYFSYNKIPVNFAVNEAFRVTLQFHETPDSTSNVYKKFMPRVVTSYNPTTVEDTLTWILVTKQYENNSNKDKILKSVAEQMPNSILAQQFYLYKLEDKSDIIKQFNHMINLVTNRIDVTKPPVFPYYNGTKMISEKEYFSELLWQFNNSVKTLYPEDWYYGIEVDYDE